MSLFNQTLCAFYVLKKIKLIMVVT